MITLDLARLELQVTPGTWTNITGKTLHATITRRDGDVGTVQVTNADADLDPTTTATLRAGRLVRISAKDGSGWAPIFTGTIGADLTVTRHPLSRHSVTIAFTAADNIGYLANTPEHRGVAAINGLRWLLDGHGVPFNINGQTTAIGAQTVVATNDSATLWDQILATRDSNLGYAWVDGENRLRVYDADQLDTTPAGTLDTSAYSSLDVDFSADSIINSVTVNFQRYAPISGTTTEIPYGPFEDAASIDQWGRYTATVTYQGLVEDEAAIAAFADSVLARASTGAVRAKSAVIPIRSEADLPWSTLDLNQRLDVVSTDDVITWPLRIVGITHTLEPTKWTVTLDLDAATGLSVPSTGPSTGISIVPEGAVGAPQIQPGAVGTNEINFTHRDIGGITTTVAATSPTGAIEGDLWMNSSHNRELHRWDGSTWQLVRDTGILDAIDLANDAQATADGKNTVVRSTSAASSPGTYKAGDLWFRYSGANVIGLWLHDGSAWISQTLRNEVIATLDAAKITTGVLEADRIAAGSITGSHLKADAIDGKHITGAVIDGGQINGTEINGVEINGATVTGGEVWTEEDEYGSVARLTRGWIQFYKNGGVGSNTSVGSVTRNGDNLQITGGSTPGTGQGSLTLRSGVDSLDPWGTVSVGGYLEVQGFPGTSLYGRAIKGAGFDTGWQPLTLSTGWTGAAHYRIIGGVVYLRGSITRTSGSNNTTMTLPASIRPATDLRVTGRNGSSTIPVGVRSDGLVNVGGYTASEPLDLESIRPFPLD